MSARLWLTLIALACSAGAAAPASADPAAGDLLGRRLFLRCASCHDLAAGESKKIGPTLHGVYGRAVASVPGYGYSPALKAKAFAWDRPMLDRWLAKPNDVVPGTSMAFAGLTSPDDRKALIDYLAKAGK